MRWRAGMVLVCWCDLRRAASLSYRGQLQVQLLRQLVGGGGAGVVLLGGIDTVVWQLREVHNPGSLGTCALSCSMLC
jgi:hypothetical protein